MYEFVVVDMPPHFDDVVLALLEEADDVLLVASMDIPSIKNLKVGIQTLDLLSWPAKVAAGAEPREREGAPRRRGRRACPRRRRRVPGPVRHRDSAGRQPRRAGRARQAARAGRLALRASPRLPHAAAAVEAPCNRIRPDPENRRRRWR